MYRLYGTSLRKSAVNSMPDLTSIVKLAALESGFELAGVAPAADARELEHFPQWIAAGRAGEM